MNLTALIGQVRTRIGTDSYDSNSTDATITAALNEALHTVEGAEVPGGGHWPWLEATTTVTVGTGGSASLGVADLRRELSVTQLGNRSLVRAPLGQILEAGSGASPQWYAISGTTLHIGPAPTGNTTFTVHYLRTEPDLSGGSSEPLLPVRYRTAIVELATSIVLRRMNRDEQAALAMRQYQEIVAVMLQDLPAPEQSGRAISSSWNAGDIIEAARQRTGTDITNTEGLGFLNAALSCIATDHDWQHLRGETTITTVAGDDTYSLPGDFDQLDTVAVRQHPPLRVVPLTELEEQPDDRGIPSRCAVLDSNELVLRPTPEAAFTLTVRYFKDEPHISSLSATPLLPVSFRRTLLVELMSYYLTRANPEDRRAALYYETYRNELAAAKRDDGKTREVPRRRIYVRPGGWL